MVRAYEFSGDRRRCWGVVSLLEIGGEEAVPCLRISLILPVFFKFLLRIRSNSVQDMSTESYRVIVNFLKTAAVKAIFYLGIWINFCSRFPQILSGLYASWAYSAAEHLWAPQHVHDCNKICQCSQRSSFCLRHCWTPNRRDKWSADTVTCVCSVRFSQYLLSKRHNLVLASDFVRLVLVLKAQFQINFTAAVLGGTEVRL